MDGDEKQTENYELSIESSRLREEIRGMLRFHYRPYEICDKLKLSRSRYYSHLKAIRRQDEKYIDQLRGKDFATTVRLTIEALEDCSRQLAIIAQDAKKDIDKIAAIALRYQIELDILNVSRVGPTVVPIGVRIGQVRDFRNVAPVQDQS